MDSKLHCADLGHTHLLALILRGSPTSRLLMKCPIGKRRETAIKDNLHCWEKNRKGVQRLKKSHLKARESIGERIQRPVDQMMGRRRKALSREINFSSSGTQFTLFENCLPKNYPFLQSLLFILDNHFFLLVPLCFMALHVCQFRQILQKKRYEQKEKGTNTVHIVMINVLDACYIWRRRNLNKNWKYLK